MFTIIESDTIITVETKTGKDIMFANPYISSKGFLTFKVVSLEGITAEYSFEDKMILLNTGSKKFGLKVNEVNQKWLDEFYLVEFEKVNDYFARSLSGNVNLIISDNNVDTKELLGSGYNPYYVKVFEYTLNQYLKTKDLDLVQLGNLILSKVNLSKYELIDDDGWKYYIVPLTDVK